jgi:hypothetical protein
MSAYSQRPRDFAYLWRSSMKYRIMSNDVGPNAYSGLADIQADTLEAAKKKAVRRFGHLSVDPRRLDGSLRLLVLPHDKFHLHNGTTGRIVAEAQQYVVEAWRATLPRKVWSRVRAGNRPYRWRSSMTSLLQEFYEANGWFPIGTVEPLEIGGIDIEDESGVAAPIGTKYVVTGFLTELEAARIAAGLGGRFPPRYRHFYKAVAE